MPELDIAASVSDIASDLGLGAGEPDPVEKDEAIDDAPAADAGADHADTVDTEAPAAAADPAKPAADPAAPAAPTARSAPKAWAKEKHEVWSKLDPSAQEYIEVREKQMLDGLSQYGEHAKYGQSIQKALQPYEKFIQANGIDAPRAVTALFEAHRNLAEGTPEQKVAYLTKVAKNYGIDISKAVAAAAGNQDEPAAVRELRERTERLENDRSAEQNQKQKDAQKRIANEVTSFAEAKDEKGNLKHPYFDECHEDIVVYINAGHALDKAYEKAIHANPVTRAKELARLQTESEANLRAKAKHEAEKARNTTRTNVTSRDTRRAPTASKANKWEDGMEDTLKEIKSRTTTH